MANNENLKKAKEAKNDEFYTLYDFIQKEINAYLEYNPDTFRDKVVLLPCDDPEWSNFTKFFAQNFETLGLRKLISTSYAIDSKNHCNMDYQYTLEDFLTDYERESPQYDEEKAASKGKIFVLEKDTDNSGAIDYEDIEWRYLEGDGDFRSGEVKALRDEADIIVTNPPFSLFREFITWIVEAQKSFLIIGNQQNVTYREIFPQIKENKMWLGATCNTEDMVFAVPEGAYVAPADREKAAKLGYVGNYTRMGNICWYTNLDHGRRHQKLSLMSMADNLKYSKYKEVRDGWYMEYVNYPAIEVKYSAAIPDDYDGAMGVSVTFLDKYNPEQFEILGIDGGDMGVSYGIGADLSKEECTELFNEHKGFRRGKLCYRNKEGKLEVCYRRILIRRRKSL